MPISKAFAQIEHQPNIYDVVHVKYFDEVCSLRYEIYLEMVLSLVSEEYFVQFACVVCCTKRSLNHMLFKLYVAFKT